MTAINDISEASWAYFAGYIDGEGSIQLKIRQRTTNGKIYRSYYSYFCITSQNRNSLVYLRSMGDMGKIEACKKKASGCVAYNLRYRASELRILLPKIIPHLNMRKELASLLLEWLDTLGNVSRSNCIQGAKPIRDNIYKRFREAEKTVRPWAHKEYHARKRTPEEMDKTYGNQPHIAEYTVIPLSQ